MLRRLLSLSLLWIPCSKASSLPSFAPRLPVAANLTLVLADSVAAGDNADVTQVSKARLLFDTDDDLSQRQQQQQQRSELGTAPAGKSQLQREGKVVFGKLFKVSRHASHGVCRAVNVTGTTAATVAGSLFKLAGAAVMDASQGLEYAQARACAAAPMKVPVLDKGVTLVAKSLKKSGDFVYRLGELAENATTEAVGMAEDAVRYLMEGTIDNVEDTTSLLLQLDDEDEEYDAFFRSVDARIIEHVVETSQPRRGARAGWRRRLRSAVKASMTAGATPSMRLQSFLACAGVLGVSARLYLKAVEGVYAEALGESIMQGIRYEAVARYQGICYEAVARYQAGVPERARWLNTLADTIWQPILEPALSGVLQRRLNIVMARSLPSNITWAGITKFTLGTRPPRLHYILLQSYDQMVAGMGSNSVKRSIAAAVACGDVAAKDIVYLEAGVHVCDREAYGIGATALSCAVLATIVCSGVADEDIMYMEAWDFVSQDSKVTVKLALPRKHSHWWSVFLSSYMPAYRVKASALQIQGKVAMGFQVRPGPPFLRRIWLTFLETPPRVRFAVEAVRGMDLSSVPILRRALQHTVYKGLAPLCDPSASLSSVPILRRALQHTVYKGLAPLCDPKREWEEQQAQLGHRNHQVGRHKHPPDPGDASQSPLQLVPADASDGDSAAAAAAAAGDGEEEVESGVAFHLIEQEDLVAAFAALGADLPNRKALAGTMLNKEHDRVSRDVWEAIDALHLGGSYFVTTEPARGVCKNAEWIEELHMRWAKKVTRGNLDRLLGMVMDNTKANRKALDLMKQKHPTWLLLGCQAHALALLIKDLHGEKNARCDWSKKAYGKALMMSNTINGSETIHSALREQQKFKYGKVKAVRSHCPTRFAILHFICSDLLDSEEAIKLMVGDRSWGKVSEGTTHAAAFTTAATVEPARGRAAAYYFFDEAAALKKLVQPVSDAIHQVESDKPLLSQMLPIWKQLLQHAADFDDHIDNVERSPVLPLFERRYNTHFDKSWPAAYVLDPVYAYKGTDTRQAESALSACHGHVGYAVQLLTLQEGGADEQALMALEHAMMLEAVQASIEHPPTDLEVAAAVEHCSGDEEQARILLRSDPLELAAAVVMANTDVSDAVCRALTAKHGIPVVRIYEPGASASNISSSIGGSSDGGGTSSSKKSSSKSLLHPKRVKAAKGGAAAAAATPVGQV
ncbi:hypothetical protein JKP88DRAFT_353427 [Tribonema minus]|uniref:SMP-LTD domain-containing protein n=1 Tax=Tribonema minus TaxID=303371 RepID=A0A836CIY7_9STRA|nr:hypothetical protein JKP88DRAFT_353427 [Tribonema minus]